MNDFTFNDIMSTARDMMDFPLQGGFGSTPGFGSGSSNGLDGSGSPSGNLGGRGGAGGFPSGTGSGGGRGSSLPSQFGPSSLRGGSGSGSPSDGSGGSLSGSPSRGGSGGFGSGPSGGSGSSAPSRSGISSLNGGPAAIGSGQGVVPQRGANGEPVYINNLGQKSTEINAGFDPKKAFFIPTDKDSQLDPDFRIPSNSFDSITGIGNIYSFGFPGGSTPQRGSLDLSEPVDPSSLNRFNQGKGGPKQQFTYPNDIDNALLGGSGSFSPSNPEFTGAINTKLAEKSPKFSTPQVYAGFGPEQFGPSSLGVTGSSSPARGGFGPSGSSSSIPGSGGFRHISAFSKSIY